MVELMEEVAEWRRVDSVLMFETSESLEQEHSAMAIRVVA